MNNTVWYGICLGYKTRDDTFSVRSTIITQTSLGANGTCFVTENAEFLPYNLLISYPFSFPHTLSHKLCRCAYDRPTR